MGWPVSLEARPAVQILRDQGKKWEQAKMEDLEVAFADRVKGTKQNGKFKTSDLRTWLTSSLASPTFIVQPRFEHPDLKSTFLANIGLSSDTAQVIPPFGAFEPDIVLVVTPVDDEIEILPDGQRQTIAQSDHRKALLISDIKHAGEANSSYSSEVVLYGVLLANWLRLAGLDGDFFVATRLGLWTRAKEISSLKILLADKPGASVSERVAAYLDDVEPVDFPIFFQTIDHFFNQDLPRVLAVNNWTDLDWHVDSKCSTCDWLGFQPWLKPADRATLQAHRDHYCVTAAEDTNHLSRLATLTRGGRRTLHDAGYADVNAVTDLVATNPVFSQHNALKADRNHLPSRADSLLSGEVTLAEGTTTIDFPRWTDLEIFITVNFDPGSGLLTALGSEARFKQRVPYGQTSNIRHNWPSDAQILLSSTLADERAVLTSFLSRLAEVFAFIHDTDSQRGGAMAKQTRIQIYFWEKRQFEELTKAIGRHLNEIVRPQTERYLRGLIWLFPPEQILEDDELTLANPITFLKNVITRDVRLPVAHCMTLFNVAREYHDPQFPPRLPGWFYHDPFSDMIPRERIYEIWTQEQLVKRGATLSTRSQCIADYADAVKKQVNSLRAIAWKFGVDSRDRLRFASRPLDISLPFNFQGMSEDARLWYGWARLEEACEMIDLRRTWSAEPEELEANYSILRLSQLESESNGDLIYSVSPDSKDCKFRDTAPFLALQDEKIPGFLDRRMRDLVSPQLLQTISFPDRNTRLSKIFEADLIELNRARLEARVRLSSFGNAADLREILISNGAVDLSNQVSLVNNSGPSHAERIRQCLLAIGRPPEAIGSQAAYEALGHAPTRNLPGTHPATPASRILWDGGAVAVEPTESSSAEVSSAVNTVVTTEWPFNVSQQKAVSHCLSHRLSVVWGPPGTGKTTTAAALIAARILIARAANKGLRLLITGPTYTAWENLFREVFELLGKLNLSEIPAFRVYATSHPARGDLPETNHMVSDVNAYAEDSEFQGLCRKLRSADEIVVVGAGAHQCYRLAKQGWGSAMAGVFDVMVLDESSQLDLCKALFPLCLLAEGGEIAFFGDHLQMPPVVQTQPPRNAEWLVGSIQSYLLRRHQLEPQPLLINYRSGSPFVAFGKSIGYPPDLTSHSPELRLHRHGSSSARRPRGWNTRVPWFRELADILEPTRRLVSITYPDGRAGQANQFEADLVCSIVQELLRSFSDNLDGENSAGSADAVIHQHFDPNVFWEKGLGIVTPHRAQRALIVQLLQALFPTHDPRKIDESVDTVERFQGGQRDTIIISFGVGDPDLISEEETFLLQLERTNVAISRARAKCVLVISEDLAYHLPADRETIETSRAVKSYVSDFCRQKSEALIRLPDDTSRSINIRWHES